MINQTTFLNQIRGSDPKDILFAKKWNMTEECPKIAVIILNYNAFEHTEECLDADSKACPTSTQIEILKCKR